MIKGNRVGDWLVVGESEKNYYSYCQCLSCGKFYDVYNSTLRLKKSSRCLKCAKKKIDESYLDNLVGKKYGRLTIKGWSKESHKTMVSCDCDCGKSADIPLYNLKGAKGVKSCGCIRKETSKKSMDKILKSGHKKLKETFVDGTNPIYMTKTLSINSTTGHRGISPAKGGKYRAYINIARKQKHLGTFSSIDEAILAREKAEREYFEKYGR